MKPLQKIFLLTACLLMACASNLSAQKGKHHAKARVHHGPRGNKVVVVKRSPHRPRKVVVFRPVWGPQLAIHRRWVFFPRYNFYWDNRRNCYVFWNAGAWICKPTPPPVVVNVNLASEKHYELKENEDDVDDVYKSNDSHKGEYKGE